jgi:hypothetical protein
MTPEPKTLVEIHRLLSTASESLSSLYGHLPENLSSDSVFALGLAMGDIDAAKTLIARDMESVRERNKPL